MNKFVKTIALGLSLTVVAGTTFAQSVGKPEDQIRWRQSAYHVKAWSMGRIKANVEGTYNKDQVIQAANVIQAIANSGMGVLYQPGTNKGKGWKETRVKAELFTDKEGVGKVAGDFREAANEMAKVATGGDAAAVKAQFGKLGEACKGCHEKFRQED
ncbi:MAG: cytochrome c [Rhodocyclaceae bacterium]|nr:cytochrome c [Rhodocyclaceae bacterium]